MNTQDILNQIEWHLEETEGENASGTFDQGYKEGCYYCEALIEQLDEPQKVKIPQRAAEMVKEGMKLGASKVEIITNAVSFENSITNHEFSKWFHDHEDTFIEAVANGFEVEEEPNWVVKRGLFYFEEFDSQMNGDKFGFNGDQKITEAHHFSDKSKAEAVADLIGGEVKKV